jgi:predicted Zn-dependent protease
MPFFATGKEHLMSPLKSNSTTATLKPNIVETQDRVHKSQSRETILLQEHKSVQEGKVHELSTIESQALFNQAIEYMNRNRYKQAISLLKEALHIAPDNPYYLSYLGLCAAYNGEDPAATITICKRALALCPGDAVVHVNLGKAYKLKGDMKSAYSVFIDAWRRNREHPAPAAELSRLGIRRPPVLTFLDRAHVLNKHLGIWRVKLERLLKRERPF